MSEDEEVLAMIDAMMNEYDEDQHMIVEELDLDELELCFN